MNDITRPDPVTAQAALDFVLWLNGAMDVLNDTPPDQAQWNKIREKVGEQIAAIVAQRIRKAAEPIMDSLPKTSGHTVSSLLGAQQALYRSQDEIKKLKIDAYESKILGKKALTAVVDDLYNEHGYAEKSSG